MESTDDALFRCSRAIQIWKQLAPYVKIREFNHLSINDRFMELFDSDRIDSLDWVCVGVWAIWNDRNNAIHGRSIPCVSDKCEWICNYLHDYQRGACRAQLTEVLTGSICLQR